MAVTLEKLLKEFENIQWKDYEKWGYDFNKEFKDAVLNLSQSEKDKLLISLLKRDKVKSNELYFKLLDYDSVDEHQLKMEKIIKEKVAYFATKRYTPNYLLKRLRSVSALITEHVKVTKDKMGDSYLNLTLLIETLETFNKKLEKTTPGQARKLGIYFVSKAFKILTWVSAGIKSCLPLSTKD